MGQLQLYQWALEEQEPERQLFLAISQAVYIRHFQKNIFQLAVQHHSINLLVIDLLTLQLDELIAMVETGL